MGCASSKQARRDRRGSPPPPTRSYSMPVHHRGASTGKVGDSQRHVVALKSSTLGSLKLDSDTDTVSDDEVMMKSSNDCRTKDVKDAVDKAKAWSEMIDSRMPKSIAGTPTDDDDQPETINAWELMAGLEDAATPTARSPRPLWMQIGTGESIVSDFDPDILSNFRKALDPLSPHHQLLLRSPEPDTAKFAPLPPLSEKPAVLEKANIPNFPGVVKARITAFQEKINAKRSRKCPPGGERRVVYYFTSLRGVRKTYEDCWAARVILQDYGVRVDERDVSMHWGFRDELREILGAGFGGSLPRAFANGRYLGGAEEVRRMHEDGELAAALEECDAAEAKAAGGVCCDACGDMRFVPCEVCSGSCKVFVAEDEEEESVAGGFKRCPDCNENGLVRCRVCC
ncbi:uncharacterized protein M6B38_116850 [Iris pallida]|uniref:Glutaredoxin domain-containing protein n=1 Tax=Iris pallida TaxID=29817 RepID=A0AAX6HT46_IRIPA|nr:uncharacterized protein M6B38_116850 [Iris pallida]